MVLLIPGEGQDVSSSARINELKEFVSFYEYLGTHLWNHRSLWRLLVVPGNHETTFLPDGTADKLKTFRKYIADKKEVVSPFSSAMTKFKDNLGEVSVDIFGGAKYAEPPFALIRDKRLDLRLLLLVSSYYSGFVPDEVRRELKNMGHGDAKQRLRELLRQDTGELKDEYISKVRSELFRQDSPAVTIAVTHHNMCQYGSYSNPVPSNAKSLLSSLADLNVRVLIHGHTHLAESDEVSRPALDGEAYPIPCPTLAGPPAPGNVNGFMLHMFGPATTPRMMTSLLWTLDQSFDFVRQKNNPHVKYRLEIYKEKVIIRKKARRWVH